MTIDWKPMTEWPPKKRRPNDDFLFWQPATANGRSVLSARAVVDRAPPGPRATTRFASINPPRSDEAIALDRTVSAIRALGGRYYLGTQFWGPRQAEARGIVLKALTGSPVPKSRAGFDAFRTALYAALGVDSFEGTPNTKENEFARRAVKLLDEEAAQGRP